MNKWEYKIIRLELSRDIKDIKNLENELNLLGLEGWEVICSDEIKIILKRQKV